MRRLGIVALGIPAALLVAGAVFLTTRVHHVLKHTRVQVAEEAKLPFDLGIFHGVENLGFAPLAGSHDYSAGAPLQGKLYLGGPAGLAEYSSSEAPPRLLRTGLDLPPAPIVSIATGRLRGDAHAQLVMATSGEGVLWYDGVQIRQLRPRSAGARDVTALLPLASGDLLIGTRQLGLLRFDGTTLTAFHPGLSNLNVTALAGDEGDFWIGTRNQGVFHWHAGQIDAFTGASGLPDAQVEAIVIAGSETFVGTPLGVAEFHQGRPARTLAPGLFAHALFTDGRSLTIASIDQGIRDLPLNKQHTAHLIADATLQPESFFWSGGLFAATRDGVFRRTASGAWQRVLAAAASPLADRDIAALSFAPDGRLWIGYFDRGLDILSTDRQHAQHVEDDHIFCINRILADASRNAMDVATANGLALFDISGHERQVLLRRDGLIADQVTDVAVTREGTTVATPAGLTFLNATGMQSLYAFHGLVNNHVYALAEDPRGNGLLAGTLGGISFLQFEKVQRNLTTANSGLKHNWITAIVPVEDGWFVGTYGAGVMRLEADGRVSAMEGATGPTEINPNAMLVTQQHVFAGSLGGGLLLYSRAGQRWSHVTAGLPSLNVTAIAQHDGQIYLGTDNGAVQIAESRLPR